MNIGFDLINDLNLTADDKFDWAGKSTSLYCIISGNISYDLKVVATTLTHLSKVYKGVFYTPGTLEFSRVTDYNNQMGLIIKMCKKIKNVALLYHHVVVIDGIAILGCPGKYGGEELDNFEQEHNINRYDDLLYLKNSIEKLQKHLDVKKIIVVTNAVPNNYLYFGVNVPDSSFPELSLVLGVDSEQKVSHWLFGSNEKIVDITNGNINYLTNPKHDRDPYWATRIEL